MSYKNRKTNKKSAARRYVSIWEYTEILPFGGPAPYRARLKKAQRRDLEPGIYTVSFPQAGKKNTRTLLTVAAQQPGAYNWLLTN